MSSKIFSFFFVFGESDFVVEVCEKKKGKGKMDQKDTLRFKLVVVGNGAVGKVWKESLSK